MLNENFHGGGRPATGLASATFQPVAPSEINLAEKIGLICLNFFLFFLFSRLLDVLLGSFHLPMAHLPMILGCMTATATVLTGGIVRAFSSRITVVFVAFTAWVLIDLPFSAWRSGSLNTLTDTWAKAILIFFAIAGLINTYKRLRSTAFILASALALAAVLLLRFGVYVGEESRLVLPVGELANSNQAALVIVLGLPLCLYVAAGQGRSKTVRLFFWAMMPLMLVVMLRTGSRAAVMALIVMLFLLFLDVSMAAKAQLLVCVLAASLLGIASLPNALRARYHTLVSQDMIYGDPAELEVQLSAMRSTKSRRALLGEGVAITLAHPLFGVGMGNFAPAGAARSVAEGHRADWSVTHNSYLQVSSELGFPGLIFYLLAMFFAWQRARFIRKRARNHPEWKDLADLALCLKLGLVGLFILMFFGSIAYNYYFPCFAALVVALERCARQMMESKKEPVGPFPMSLSPALPARARNAAFLPARGRV